MSDPTLSETLDTLSSFAEHESDVIRVVDLEIALPVEVIWRRRRGDDDFVVTPPRWRWRTDFDREPARLNVRFCAAGGAR